MLLKLKSSIENARIIFGKLSYREIRPMRGRLMRGLPVFLKRAIVFENHSIVHLTTQGKVIFKSIILQWAAWKDSCSPIFSLNESWIQNTEGVLNHIKWFL